MSVLGAAAIKHLPAVLLARPFWAGGGRLQRGHAKVDNRQRG
jgi:hypothetical protein